MKGCLYSIENWALSFSFIMCVVLARWCLDQFASKVFSVALSHFSLFWEPFVQGKHCFLSALSLTLDKVVGYRCWTHYYARQTFNALCQCCNEPMVNKGKCCRCFITCWSLCLPDAFRLDAQHGCPLLRMSVLFMQILGSVLMLSKACFVVCNTLNVRKWQN